jgi:plastocyanin
MSGGFIIMRLPPTLGALLLIVAGAFLPALGKAPEEAPAGTVGMSHEDFTTTRIEVPTGDTLTFVNDSRYMHIIGPGRDGSLAQEDGDPVRDRVLVETNGTYTTPPFEVPGTYYITCSMHPQMTVRVTVAN